MKSIVASFTFLLATISLKGNIVHTLPHGFVFLTDIDPTIQESPRYYSHENFTGKRVEGYTQPRIICTQKAAEKLKQAHDVFKKTGYNLVVYDAYRPQCAVDSFIKWSQDSTDQKMKSHYYPTIDKKDVFELGYVSARSGHTRGSTFDLTLIEIGKKVLPIIYTEKILMTHEIIPFLDDNTVDMGSSFDLDHQASHHDTLLIDVIYTERRNFLRSIMMKHGFEPYPFEWWHYSLKDEPYLDTYFNFVYR